MDPDLRENLALADADTLCVALIKEAERLTYARQLLGRAYEYAWGDRLSLDNPEDEIRESLYPPGEDQCPIVN